MTEPEVREKFAAEFVGDQEEIWTRFDKWLLRDTFPAHSEDGYEIYSVVDVDRFIEWVRFGRTPDYD